MHEELLGLVQQLGKCLMRLQCCVRVGEQMGDQMDEELGQHLGYANQRIL